MDALGLRGCQEIQLIRPKPHGTTSAAWFCTLHLQMSVRDALPHWVVTWAGFIQAITLWLWVFLTFVFLVPLTWGDLLEAVLLALGESVLLPLTWGQLIGGNSSGHYPKVLVAELAKPKPPLIAAKAPWTGVALPPAPTSSLVACLYLWIYLPFFALYSKFPCVALCVCAWAVSLLVVSCGYFGFKFWIVTMTHCYTAGCQHWWLFGLCKTNPCAAFLTSSFLPFSCLVLLTIFIGSNVLIGLNAFIDAHAFHLLLFEKNW